ncbi:hypothetical protein SAY87_019878 [Trapa incisa]|uniref:DUF538 domain-containing protein n=1 Tax=Trapa incisa TaxID=236973 RepID=A0AAN7K324_9MYRT|nr:hypothetical protein SAY87_019878 [Trapa incisa]
MFSPSLQPILPFAYLYPNKHTHRLHQQHITSQIAFSLPSIYHTIPSSQLYLVEMSRGQTTRNAIREGAEIVYGQEECYRHSVELLEELGFPKGVMPLRDLVECGRVKETGFVWMKLRAPYEHFFVKTNTRVSYGVEVTAYVEKFKMKKMTGIKSKQMFMWVPISEMSIDDPSSSKICFRTPMGIGKSFPASAFVDEDEVAAEEDNGGVEKPTRLENGNVVKA